MIIHCVFLNFDAKHSAEERKAVMRDLGALMPHIDGMLTFSHGPNRDFENKTPDHAHGFVATFRDRSALQAYAGHPRHMELGSKLVAMCVGGSAGILVFDIETE